MAITSSSSSSHSSHSSHSTHSSHSRPGPRTGPGAGGRPTGRPGGRFGRPPARRKVCRFCAEKVVEIDYKAAPLLRGFMTDRGKVISGRTTGTCAKHQRQLTTAIKRGQNLALLPVKAL
ncbi:MAG TPA: 30S ribosomal protein S18 [Elusimicrobiota bacterium]|nr:30S ribosomal protein S18 [Elusimicrobiota bacterium]